MGPQGLRRSVLPFVPGLLQTPEYARAISWGMQHSAEDEIS